MFSVAQFAIGTSESPRATGSVHLAERSGLFDLAHSTDFEKWVHSHNWLSSFHVCDWQLVGCDMEGHVKVMAPPCRSLQHHRRVT